MGHDDFSQKILQRPLLLAPVLTNKILGRKQIASAKYRTGIVEKRRSAPQIPRNSVSPFSSVVHYTPVAEEKKSVTPYGCTVMLRLHCTTNCTTLLYYFKLLLNCSIPGTLLLVLLYYCCCTVLYRTCVLPY